MAPYCSKSTFDGGDFDPNSGARLFVFSKKMNLGFLRKKE